ncbi:alpha/beta fold hydrolase [Aestuariivirga sp.]|uniref:alpha/beta fold hydrolase n=1 Tax=Aestuariivirga sp. TaxID=2650926 RepID=UPI003BAAF85F
MATIKAPALVIHGAEDPLIPMACGQDTALSIANVKYLPIEGMGHDLPPELDPIVIEAICEPTKKSEYGSRSE